jgi:ribonuclease Z
MDLSLVFLGTGGSVPSARRATACVLIRSGGSRLLVDAGEGAQRQMINSTGLVQVDDIYITHFHADHYLGLPGLLKTYDLLERRAPLRIAGPAGLHALFEAMRRIFGKLRYKVELVELGPGDAIEHDGFEVRAFAVEHGMRALGYAYVEPDRPGRFDVAAARGLGITDDRDFGRLQRGETISVNGSEVRPDQVMGEPRQGRKVVITGDTGPCEMTRVAAHAAQLLVHDGTFAIEESLRAAETGHSTARDAAQLAADAEVAMLAIVHVSSRYNVSKVLTEAREAFPKTVAPRDFDLVEIPFPERGEPHLIEEGARRRPEPQAEPLPIPGD